MADRWIVSSYEFHQHESLEVATREAERLAEKTGKVMHVHRVKTTLQRSDAMAVIERLNARIKELEAERVQITQSVGEVSQKIELDIGAALAALQESPELCAIMTELVAPVVGKELNAAHARIAELEIDRQRMTGTVADIPDSDLLRRAVKNARASSRCANTRGYAVQEIFALGSTYAAQLCRRFDLDPYEMVQP